MRRTLDVVLVLLCCSTIGGVWAQSHNPGGNCLSCHAELDLGGTVFSDTTSNTTLPGVSLRLIGRDGQVVDLGVSNPAGNIYSTNVAAGNYRVELGAISSKTWHVFPTQASCNPCHRVGGNPSQLRTKVMPDAHTRVAPGNRCEACHFFPASMRYGQLMTPGVLVGNEPPLPNDDSFVQIDGATNYIAPGDLTGIQTVRPDIFAPGFFSAFDVILAVAAQNGIAVEYEWDELAKTHWITSVDGVPGNYWYGWANDDGQGGSSELNGRRDNRWDEFLWREGTKLRLNEGVDDIPALVAAFREEIARETDNGGPIVGIVELSVNASVFRGNPPGAGRVTANLTVPDLTVTAHDLRGGSAGVESLYSRPFQPGVVTSMDVLFSLEDAGAIEGVSTVFLDRIATSLIESHYMQGFRFPDAGLSHASGSHGYTCRTHLLAEGAVYSGSSSQHANDAAAIQHVPHDILPIHAPDYSLWRWRELGPPHYEASAPAPAWALPVTIGLERVGDTELRVRWPATPCAEAQDYGIYEGTLGDWTSHQSIDCHDDGGDLEEIVPLSPGDRYYLVVPRDAQSEGSFGLDANGFERPRGGQECAPAQRLVCP